MSISTPNPQRTEAEIEERLIELLCQGHNQWTYRGDLKSEESLWENLRQKINQNNVSELQNHPLTDQEFDRLKTELLSRTQTPFDAAKWLKGENGIAHITIDREDVSLGSVSLVLYSNHDIGGGISSYEVVNQIAKKKADSSECARRFDVTLLINGLPIVQIELKKSTAKDGVFQAYNQIKKYAEEKTFQGNIFSTLQLFIISNEQNTRYFANAKPANMDKKFIFSWRTSDNRKVDDVYEFCQQVLYIPDAHRLIADYTVVSEDEDNKVLMVLHPYQVHAIEAMYTSAMKHTSGYIWHATGSGKTLTSFVATKLLARKTGVDRTIMLIDRKDLNNQTTSEFTKFASEFNTGISTGSVSANALIIGTDSAQELSERLLSDENSNTIIVTTRQKLDFALRYTQKQADQSGKKRFEKLQEQHIVFVVDECHRAVSSEGMEEIKSFFPNLTWFGFTGTPIFPENKKQAQGQLARTTHDQYGECLHTYTIKNALDDGAVLSFQVEHENTIEPTSLDNLIFKQLRQETKYANLSNDQINDLIDQMSGIEKETYLDGTVYEDKKHIHEVIHKIFRPDNAYVKFDFQNGKPQKSAILTTSSIEMAKHYYAAIKEMTAQADWIRKEFANHPMREGRAIDDPDFPRIAITYSLQENPDNAALAQKEMKEIIANYNKRYGTTWTVEDIGRYNNDINNRLARKKGEFRKNGNQIDLAIVVDRLLTGFDAPTMQTLFVDRNRNLAYANLIQAFSRTNRTYPAKTKGLIVTFRKPYTMEQNVEEATRLYSQSKDESALIYPSYEKSQKHFKAAYKTFTSELPAGTSLEKLDEHSPLEDRIEFIKGFQELSRAFDTIVTYDEYNDEIELSPALQKKVKILEDYVGTYNTVKASIPNIASVTDGTVDFSGIEFFNESTTRAYEIDAFYINHLLGNYHANDKTVQKDIEKALQKMGKSENVKAVYKDILRAIDMGEVNESEDILAVKRRFFTDEREGIIREFAQTWCSSADELFTSAVQYSIGADPIPNMKNIIAKSDFDAYKSEHTGATKLKYNLEMKRAWCKTLDEQILPLDTELR